MSTDTNKQLVRRAYVVYETGDVSELDHVMAADYVDHNPVPGQDQGVAGVKRKVLETRKELTDIRLQVHDQIAERDRVASRMTFTALHRAGKHVSLDLIAISEINGGRIVAEWGIADLAGLMAQLTE